VTRPLAGTAMYSEEGVLLECSGENGLVQVLREALGADAQAPPGKVTGSAAAIGLAAIEALWCWTEATCSFYVCAFALRAAVLHLQGPRAQVCELRANQVVAAAHCAVARDWPLVAAHAGAVAGMALWLSWRFGGFFGLSRSQTLARMLPRRGLSVVGAATLVAMVLGFCFQVGLEMVLHRGMFSSENFLEPHLGLSALRSAQLLILIPLREELVFRGFVLHIFKNRADSRRAGILTGVSFGLMHFANAGSRNFSWSFVRLQVLLSTLVGSFLSTRMLLEGRTRGLSEPVVLHCFNNLLSSMLGSSTDVDLFETWNLISLALTAGVFGRLLQCDLKRLEGRGKAASGCATGAPPYTRPETKRE
jgi:membrane protease YdiL (CAAX protease family)